MKNFVGLSVKKFLRPLLINFISVKKIQDYNDDFKSKKLLENGVKFKVTEVENENIDLLRETYLRRYEPRFEENVVWFNEYLELNGEPEYSPKQQNTEISRTFQKKLCALLQYEFSEPVPGGVIPHDNTVAVAISLNGRLVVNQAFSLQDRENVTPANEDMVSPIASITKTFTALMIMKLIEEEAEREERPPHKKRCSESDEESDSGNRRVPRITLDTYVEDILTPDVWPEHFVEGETSGQKHKVTIKQLLQHTAGLKSNMINEEYDEDQRALDAVINDNQGNLTKSIKQIQHKNLTSKPGENFSYSNYGYQLLALVYEKRTGRSFVEDLRDEFAKMGLYDTDFNYREYLALDKARGLTKEARGIEKTIFVDMTWHEADYGLVSTVSDLVKYGNIFASCLLNKENLNTNPLSNSQANKMSNQCHHIVTKVDDRWVEWRKEFHQGLGWVVKLMAPLDLKSPEEGAYISEFLIEVFGHGGSTELNESQVSVFKESGCKTRHHKVLQKRPLMYPLGEDFESEQDIVVGAIIIERLGDQGADDILSKIMNLVRYEYLRSN